MAFTDTGKVEAMKGIAALDRYVSLHLSNDTELSGHGYSRKAVSAAVLQAAIGSDGQISLSNVDVYTATDGSAQDADKVALYDAATGGNQLMEPETLTTDVGAPALGQTFRLTTLTLTP